MQKIRQISLVGLRADGSQTLGTATDGVTMTIQPSKGIHLVPTGGSMTIRKSDEPAAEAVTWPEDFPFTAEGFEEAMGSTENLPSLIISIPVGVTVSGWVSGTQPEIA